MVDAWHKTTRSKVTNYTGSIAGMYKVNKRQGVSPDKNAMPNTKHKIGDCSTKDVH